MITLPIERILRQQKFPGYADDQHVDLAKADAIKAVLGAEALENAPFFVPGSWSYVQLQQVPPPNIAEGMPENLAAALAHSDAFYEAAKLPASQWSSNSPLRPLIWI